jgi:ADP-heptose:LPS heptosyltransferase
VRLSIGKILILHKYISKHQVVNKFLLLMGNIIFLINRKIHILFKKKWNNKIVVISIHRMGDTVFTIPAIKKLFQAADKEIIIFCYEDSQKIYDLVFNNYRFVKITKSDFLWENRIAAHRIRKILKEINPEIIIDLTGGIQSASLFFNSSAKRIFGFSEQYFRNIYTDFIPPRKTPHLMDLYMDVINLYKPFEREESDKKFEVSIKHDGVVMIHPFAGWAAKEWDNERFIKLTSLINEDYKYLWIVQEELDEGIKVKIEEEKVNVKITRSIEELIESIKDCAVFISNDSGPLYIASLLGKPTFTVYGPTNPLYSLPHGEFHRMIQKKIECSPRSDQQYCFTHAGLFCPDYQCMNLLSVNEVYQSIKKFLEDLNIESKVQGILKK